MDYNKLKKSELIQICVERKINYSSSLTKEKLIELIIEHEVLEKKKEVIQDTPKKKPVQSNRPKTETTTPVETHDEVEVSNQSTANETITNDEVFVRGDQHNTFMAFLIVIGSSFITPIVFFISFFYWPLIRKWLNYIGEFYWAWTLSLSKWVYTIEIFMFIITLVLSSFMVGVVISIFIFMFWKSLFNGYKQARINREYYVSNIHYK